MHCMAQQPQLQLDTAAQAAQGTSNPNNISNSSLTGQHRQRWASNNTNTIDNTNNSNTTA